MNVIGQSQNIGWINMSPDKFSISPAKVSGWEIIVDESVLKVSFSLKYFYVEIKNREECYIKHYQRLICVLVLNKDENIGPVI